MARSRSRSRRSSRRSSGGNAWKIPSVIMLSLVGVGFVAFFLMGTLSQQTEANRITGCPIDQSEIPVSITIIYDTSEPLVESQELEIQNRINAIVRDENQFPVFSKLAVYRVESDINRGITPVNFSFDGSGASSSGIEYFCRPRTDWTQSPLWRRFNEQLPDMYTVAVLNSVGNSGEQYSPLIDALRYVASSLFASSETTKNRVIIVSDLIENSEIFSMYQNDWYETFTDDRESVLSQSPNFPAGTSVEVLLLRRPQYSIQSLDPSSNFQRFWESIIAANRNVGLTMTTVSGGL